MAMDLGSGVSETLSATQRQFQVVVWQKGKPPLDSEFNLAQQVEMERSQDIIRSSMPSGWLLDPFSSDQDWQVDRNWSNFFKFGNSVAWANVNGWIIPVTGTGVPDGESSNRLNLFPAPSTDARIDFVFLEVWLGQIHPNPSTVNKPSASTLWKYGNVEFGGTNLTDDLINGDIGVETSERVQLQYRLRVFGSGTGHGHSVDLSTFPDGLDDPNVLAQGASSNPQGGFPFTNMQSTLGDPGLWRSGNGDPTNSLGTVDGYVYAIPLCAVFRRNTASFVARTNGGNANQNGALNRNPNTAPITNPVEGTRVFGPVTLTAAIDAGDTGAVLVSGLSGSGLDNPDIDWASTFLTLDDEIIGISSVDAGAGTITIRPTGGRGRNGTQARPHDANTDLKFFIFRPDGRTSDMITKEDILDLRKGVTHGEWDYQALLAHNLGKVFNNTLKSCYKQAAGSDTQGPLVVSVDTLWANGSFSTPNQTEALDGPDGIRTVFSDAAVVEMTSLILNPVSTGGGNPTQVSDYTLGATSWGPAAGFSPSGFQPTDQGWTDRAVIQLFIGGTGGDDGARATVRTAADNRIVRFVSPREYWLSRDEIDPSTSSGEGNQCPFQLRFVNDVWGVPAGASDPLQSHPGPMFPLPEFNFERPFIVLGGVVNSALRNTAVSTIAAGSSPSSMSLVRFPGENFDTAGSWHPAGGVSDTSTDGVTNLLLHGSRNLYDMLTAGGRDRSGNSSELYLVLTGDTTNASNTGVFRVVGAGTVGYTTESGSTAEDLVVERVGEGPAALVASSNLTAEVRSQHTHTQDQDVGADGAAAVIVLTDLNSAAGGSSSPWDGLLSTPAATQAILDAAILYGPSRGGTARVADQINRFAMVGINAAEMVREAPTGLDGTFDTEAGVPDEELYFPVQHIQTWNRLPSLGLGAPLAPDYGDGDYLGERRREAEIFVDTGSKTLMIRPFQRTDLTLHRYQTTAGPARFFPSTYTAGSSVGVTVDGGSIFTVNADYAYSFPWEFMPRFGRQDIPYHAQDGTSQAIYPGINHLFGDSQNISDKVFRLMGGQDSSSGVVSLFIQTGATSGRSYGEYFNMGGSANGYQGRIYEDVSAVSSDLDQRGLKGIQLPPFLGVARVYGVYDLREFSGQGAYNADRVTLSTSAGRPKNLLKTDSDKQTLFIVRGGAEDVTGSADDHTYVIPQDIIDVRLSGQHVPGETFDDVEYVVECVVFGFARGFINKNNWILARNNLPDGGSGIGVGALAGQVSCILPLPLPYNEQCYVSSERTVYQGDPFMTRDGATKTVSDYETRLGQIPQSGAVDLGTPIQQYDSTNGFAQVPETPNTRAVDVLASIDFYTTIGTGKIGGPIYPGTPLDVGHITNAGLAPTRIPASGTDPIWQSEVRTFTEPQGEDAPGGSVSINVLLPSAASAGETITIRRGSHFSTITSNVDFSAASVSSTAQSLVTSINSALVSRNIAAVVAVWDGGSGVQLISRLPGTQGEKTTLELGPSPGNREVTGFSIVPQGRLSRYGLNLTSSPLLGGEDRPVNGKLSTRATTPVRLAGLTERLPLGILLQDADFLGEDPLRNGVSSLVVTHSGGVGGSNTSAVLDESIGCEGIQGAGSIGLSDGGILRYTPWTLSTTTGSRVFRLFRGGGSAYTLDPAAQGGPVDWSSGGYSEGMQPVMKGAVLAGRAFLVRNYPETAFSASEQRSHGGEIQMVILTNGVVGHGPVDCGYALDGQISPTGYGEGLAAVDRYRIEGKPLVKGQSKSGVSFSTGLAPFPSEDEGDPDPCA